MRFSPICMHFFAGTTIFGSSLVASARNTAGAGLQATPTVLMLAPHLTASVSCFSPLFLSTSDNTETRVSRVSVGCPYKPFGRCKSVASVLQLYLSLELLRRYPYRSLSSYPHYCPSFLSSATMTKSPKALSIYSVVMVTVPNVVEAEKVAAALIKAKAAACVNIVPGMTSIFEWEGKIEKCQEYLLIIKTTKALFDTLKSIVIENHSYDCPEVIEMDVTNGSTDYLEWISQVTSNTTTAL
ncbi:divalent cation tolerance protein, CutA1 family protein [Cardiosporidium cionae]|uniref:Divalent cation tolerance protein, CutA1 family protein n=1 Tax=Cardiosporidium cionae TaxID=476202 RepID=A0ABQ7JGM5_9APIC|nr:divalent cation tolerance protein, CutA1 family protein [Cardiosporidium cionae]|eukprot:KAF8823128.1 divalent cation tolerance protein, CutA1 family protein [Cardiosporidium cionae]